MKPISLIMDSGAYSAFTQGKAIDIDAYCSFCSANWEYIDTVVNLDVINPKDPEVAAEAGMKNFLDMRNKGIAAMPVFHARESTKWLDQMLDITNYVGLSGTSLVSPVESRSWHRLIWNYVTDSEGRPIARFHAFGDTSEWSLLTFPWYSCDSATWMIQAGRAGRVKLKGKSYQLRSHSIGDANFISEADTGLKRESWEQEITELGLNPERVMNVKAKGSELAMIRSYLVAADLLKLQEQTAYVRRFLKPPSLITNKRQIDGGVERQDFTKVYFVISPSAWYFNFSVIAALNIKHILVSYYYVATAQKEFWEEQLLPFIDDPLGFCEKHPKLKKFWDKLNEVLLKPVAV